MHFLVGLPHDDRTKEVRNAARDAFEIMKDTIPKADAQIVPESKVDELVKKIESDVGHARQHLSDGL